MGRLTPTTTMLDAVPEGIATIPEDSLAPLLMGLALFGFFLAVIYQRLWLTGGLDAGDFPDWLLLNVAAHGEGGCRVSTVQVPPPQVSIGTLPLDQERGINCMWCVIATEFMLFVSMFGAYYYLGSNSDRWADHVAPKYWLALLLLAILLSSSLVLAWGDSKSRQERFAEARICCWITVLLGIGFMVLQGYEYSVEWKDITPYSDSYGSIFYSITTLHALHVIAGLLLLMYIGVMPRYGWTRRTPHKPYTTVALYWHFVDAVWILIVLLLYIIPNIQRYAHVHH